MNNPCVVIPCVVIPIYNHEHAIEAVVMAVRQFHLPCILVDDGSTKQCAQKLDEIAASSTLQSPIFLVRLPQNLGKGAAVLNGIHYAAQQGFTHALQIDADGQHCTGDIPRFLTVAKKFPEAVIIGRPIFDTTIPKARLYARYLTHVWVWINTWSFNIQDSMCGFRVYPIDAVLQLIAHQKVGSRMNFDTDILVRLFWQNVEIINVPTYVTYPSDGVSHFRTWLDNVLITRMHITLFFGMLWRIPKLIKRKLRAR